MEERGGRKRVRWRGSKNRGVGVSGNKWHQGIMEGVWGMFGEISKESKS